MKKLVLASILTLVAMATAFAQPSLQWDKRFNGPVANDKGNAIALDANGNVYVTCSSDGATASDYLTIKYNANGDTLWSKRYNGSANGQDEPIAIKVDAAGNVYVIGKSQGNGTGLDLVTIKYNSSGVQQWVAVYNSVGSADDLGYDIIIDAFGNSFIVASTAIIKYNASGIKQWSTNSYQFFDLLSTEPRHLININAFNNVVIAIDDPQAFDNYVVIELNPSNGVLINKYNQPFIQPFYGTPIDMVLDANANMYVLSTIYSASNNPIKIRVAKFTYGNTGSAAWISGKDAANGERISGIDMDIDADLNTYVLCKYYIGNSNNPLRIKFNSSGFQISGGVLFTPGTDNIPVSIALNKLINPDIFIVGYTATGNITLSGFDNNNDLLWDQIIYDCGNNGQDIASAMISDVCGNIYITGYSNCNGTFKDVKTIKYVNSATITASGPLTFCQGGSVVLTVTPSGNSYLWSNGATVQSITVTSSGSYSVTVGSNGCSATSQATSVSVNPILTASVSLVASSTIICSGQNVTFTASSTNGGATPVYQWFVNNNPVGNGPTYSTTTLPNGAQVYCTMTSSATCANPLTATSNIIAVTVNPTLAASVNIVASSTSICPGQIVTFTATPTNGGSSPAYQWFANTIFVGIGSTYSTTTLTNGSQVYCAMISSATCASPPTSTSNIITVTVNPLLTPNLSIIASPAIICSGQNAAFTATPINGGTMPTYQWFVNNILVGTGPTYLTTTLTNGAQVYCTMMSNALCASPATATSPIVTITVIAPPNVQITPSDPTTFCAGNSVILTASPTGSYSWSTGATTKSITVFTFGNYTVNVTAINGCSAVSAPTTVTVNPLPQTPMVFPPGPITISCQGGSAKLTSSFANAYSWNTGASTQNITVTAVGDYSVTITNLNGCTAASNATSVLCNVNTNEAALPEGFLVSPNPSNGSFTVGFFLPEAKMVSYRVLNVLGQVVWAAAPGLEAGECQRKIDLGLGIMPGIYFLETRLDGRAFLRKIEVW